MKCKPGINTWLANNAVGTDKTIRGVLDIFYDNSKMLQGKYTREEYYEHKYNQYHEEYDYNKVA